MDFQWLSLVLNSFFPLLLAGLSFTMPLSILSFIIGIFLGFITALLRLYGGSLASRLAKFYVWVFRGTPLLVQLFLIFYGLPNMGILIAAFPAAVIGFSLNMGAYTSETIRAAISSVHQGQWEAANSIGLGWLQTMKNIILPQAARVATPPLSNSFISLVKDTSLAAAITVPELFQTAQRIAAVHYEPLLLYVEAAIMYLLFCTVLSTLQSRLETNLSRHIAISRSS